MPLLCQLPVRLDDLLLICIPEENKVHDRLVGAIELDKVVYKGWVYCLMLDWLPVDTEDLVVVPLKRDFQ